MRLTGKWRIIKMELWGRDFIDLLGPGFIAFDGRGRGEFRFGAVDASMDCSDTLGGADFTWEGFDEMDESRGEGWADLQDDGSLVGEISFHNGDESTFRARAFDGSERAKPKRNARAPRKA